MENDEIEVKTLTYFSNERPTCKITYKGIDYYLNRRVVEYAPYRDTRFVEFWQLPGPVQKEYLLWKMSRS